MPAAHTTFVRPPQLAGWITNWVCVTCASIRPSGPRTVVCQTIVWRPRWSGRHSAVTVVPVRPGAKKFVFDSIVVVP